MHPESPYKSWPGLENPLGAEPIEVLRDQYAIECQRRHWRKLASTLHRARRAFGESYRLVLDELQSANKKTLGELLVAALIAAVAIKPVRERLEQWDNFWWAYAAVLLVGVLLRIAKRRTQTQTVARRVAEAAIRLQVIIDFQRKHTKERERGRAATKEHLQNTIRAVLQALADVARITLQIPDSVQVYANLMVPMPVQVAGAAEKRRGCGIVAYSSTAPARTGWTRLVLEDFGAAEAFRTNKVVVIEDPSDPIWCGIFGPVRAKCFACFPVRMDSNRVVAVVNIDASRARVLTEENAANELHRAISGALSLLADILYNTREGATEGRRAGLADGAPRAEITGASTEGGRSDARHPGA